LPLLFLSECFLKPGPYTASRFGEYTEVFCTVNSICRIINDSGKKEKRLDKSIVSVYNKPSINSAIWRRNEM